MKKKKKSRSKKERKMCSVFLFLFVFFFFQAEDGIRDRTVTGVQTCALPICRGGRGSHAVGASAPGTRGDPRGLGRAGARSARAGPGGGNPPRAGQSREIGRASCRERV